MGKKKRTNQNSNNVITNEDSSESESSKESTQGSEANKTACPHINKSVDANQVRKCLKINKDKNIHWFCLLCKVNKSVHCEDGWVCLRCGAYNCGQEVENHSVDHYKTPRSDSHYLSLHINNNKLWCFTCEQEVPIDATKKVQNCVDFIKKMYRPNECSLEVDSDNNEKDSNLAYLKPDDSLNDNLQKLSINEDEMKPASSLPRVRGLANLGNTCFFNSVLQCLAQTPGLVELLKEMEIPGEKFHLELDDKTIDAVLGKPVPIKPSFTLLCEQLVQILPEVSGVGHNGDGDAKSGSYTVNPRRLLSALTKRCPQFEGGDQHDSHELLRHLLDSVHSEDLRRYQKAILDHIGYSNKDELDENKKEFAKKLNHKVCDTIPIRPDQIFKGSLVSILQCDVCKHISNRAEPFLDLSLPVAQEKAQPPRRKPNCSSPVEVEQKTEAPLSKHQQKKEKRLLRRNNQSHNHLRGKKEQALGEPTIDEEEKKDSLNGDQSDADVEDNEENACEEQDHKTEVVESGYSSEKQMSARGSPITTQSPEEESKYESNQGSNDLSNYQSCETNPNSSNKPFSELPSCTFINTSTEGSEVSLAKRAESGIGSIQELTLTIPEEVNTECASQDSVRVNASNGSQNLSLDSHLNHFKTVDLTSVDYNLPQNMENEIDRSVMVQEWNCMVDPKLQGQSSSCVSLSVSPRCGSQSSQDNNASPRCSPKSSPMSGSHMSLCTSLPASNDNMSVCNSLPENISMILNSPVKSLHSQRDENSGSEERPESRLECQKNRSSPVEMGEATQLDSSLLKLSLEGMTSYSEHTERIEDLKVTEDNMKTIVSAEPHLTATDSSAVVVDLRTNHTAIPLPPPPPPTKIFSSLENPYQRLNSGSQKYKIEEGECSLISCLNQFTVTELLAGANKVGCEACTEKINKGNKEGKTVYQNSTKQLLICKLPPVMIFHLKRFQLQNCSFRKISRHVDFPLVLDISQFCVKNEDKKDKEPMLYSLYGIVEHSGTLHGGHYVAYVKVRSHTERRLGEPPKGKWYYISDSYVRDVDESEVLKTQAYLLFYERIL